MEKYRLRDTGISVSCLVLHTKTEKRQESQLFESSTTAKQFLDGMTIESEHNFWLGERIIKAEMKELK